MLCLEDFLRFGQLLALLVLGSGTWLDAWRAAPVRSDPGYVRETMSTLAASD